MTASSSIFAAASLNASWPRRAMADHAVGGVDRLVGHHTRQTEQRAPHHRRHHGVGVILGKALDGRARNSCFIMSARVSRPTILATASRLSFDAALVERIGNGSDMLIKTPLCDQSAGEAGENDKRERRRKLRCDVLGD